MAAHCSPFEALTDSSILLTTKKKDFREMTKEERSKISHMTDTKLPLSTSDKKSLVKLRIATSGAAATIPITVIDQFKNLVNEIGDSPALHQQTLREGASAEVTEWTTWTWKQYYSEVESFAKSLISIGFEPFDVVNIVGFNSPEWHFSNLGAIAAGGIAAGIYATNLSDACKYISEHSKAKIVVVEGRKQLDKYINIFSELPYLKAIITYGPEIIPQTTTDMFGIPIYSFESFLKLGKDIDDAEVSSRINSQVPNQVCSLIYTSGTTGNPKGVMITNDNLTWTSDALLRSMPRLLDNSDHVISYLPLSHIAAQMLDIYAPIGCGMQIWFAKPDALRGSLVETLKQVRPTVFFGVPRVWEKMYDAMQKVAQSTTGVKKVLSGWAKDKATKKYELQQYNQSGENPYFISLAELVLGAVHKALGLDRCIACFTGAAPIEEKIIHYFASVGLPILELFGQSECTGPHTVNKLGAWKIGTCGRPLPGTVSKIDEHGELCYKGRHIFAGYMGMEDKTRATIDEDGWLHSGDIATFDDCDQPVEIGPSGFMRITGRIKELIITAGGENIPPVLIENELKDAMPALSNCMLIGDKRKFLSVLLCLTVEVDSDGVPSDKLAGLALSTSKDIGSGAITTKDAQSCPKWKAYFDEGMLKANERAASNAQRVAKWALLVSDFSEKGDELTPTLKLKRSVVAVIHAKVIERIYS